MENSIKIISIVGPTASGKTELSISVAKEFSGEIISADSIQVYRDMKIASAKPDKAQMEGIPHHLIDFLPLKCTYSVADFVRDAGKCAKAIAARGKIPILVGGTGLYVDSFLNNIDFGAYERDEALTRELYRLYENNGADFLLDILKGVDPEAYDKLKEQKNIKRIIRAIEFYKTAGITISEQNRKSRALGSPYKAVKIGLSYRDRQKLYDRINRRVDIMLENGLLKEAQKVLSSDLSNTSGAAIGYKELIPYFSGERTLDNCVETLKRETRRYAKRQLTWFNRDPEINWIYKDEYEDFDGIFKTAAALIKKECDIWTSCFSKEYS